MDFSIVPSQPETTSHVQHSLPCVIMRPGTSKGVFIHKSDLPKADSKSSAAILQAALGACSRQIDGIGGAHSTTSKVAIVSKSTQAGIDVDYTFAQVGWENQGVDITGNCGNMLSGVAPFAIDEGLVVAEEGARETDVRIYNTNTSRLITATCQVSSGKFKESGAYKVAAVRGTSSDIKLAFTNPAGSMTGKLFPTGNLEDLLTVNLATSDVLEFQVTVTLCDAANPFVFVDKSSMPPGWDNGCIKSKQALEIVEAIRRVAAVNMSLAKDVISAGTVKATPKIALLSPARDAAIGDINIIPYTIGVPHPTFQVTGAICLAAAIVVPGTIAYGIATEGEKDRGACADLIGSRECSSLLKQEVKMEHLGGDISATVEMVKRLDVEVEIKSVNVSKTARRVMEGVVFYYL